MLTYKRKLILSKGQQSRIDRWMGACRVIYNLALEIRIWAWKNKQKPIHKYELMKQLKDLKDIDWIKDVSHDTLQKVIERLDTAYKVFFSGGGFPKWASKKKQNSFVLAQTTKRTIFISGDYIAVPKLGKLKIFKDAEIKGNIKRAIIKKEAKGYFINIVTDAIKNIQNKDKSQVVGLDMGVKYLYVDSSGRFVENPKHFKKYERLLRIESRALSRKKKNSNSWKNQCSKLALLHNKIRNVRKDFLHKESTTIAKQYSTVYIENLNIQNMAKSKLSGYIYDCGWGLFRQLLSYKTNVVAVDPKYTSQTCNSCGVKDKNSRINQSKFVCTSCGEESNADENAAKNIRDKGIVIVRQREALACA